MTPDFNWRQVHGLEVLFIGEVEVGRVHRTGGRNGRPRWLFQLDQHGAFWRDEKTIEICRAQVIGRMVDWLRRAKVIS